MIKRFLYDLSLFALLILFFPKLMIDFFFKGKYRQSILARLYPEAIKNTKKPVIWLHGVSLGETKALSTLIPHMRKAYPQAYLFVTTVTETGYNQAQKLIPDVDAIHYLPLDFSWIIKSFVRMIQPQLLILVEGDYWYNLMREVKRRGGRIAVVNGKMSEKSLKRYHYFKSLFSFVDHFCLQGESYRERFLKLGISPKKMTVTGNLKFDIPMPEMEDLSHFKQELHLEEGDRVITLGSTHEGEEELLMRKIKPLQQKDPHLKVLLVPRHPERFARVKSLLAHYPQTVLIDKMGVLSKCYRISDLAIIGGSFVNGVGGHDIFESAKMGVPTLFGPYMYKQVDLTQLITQSGAGKMLSLEALLPTLEELLYNPHLRQEMGEKGILCGQKAMGSALRTWKEIACMLDY
ncbi:MAG: 3-deoxy-D-manno-octulosonic acid transferase [Chlamydiia bacterium]|nr:3-deoxy-D-manno-octulosonic acid transferase [Chlamydiia bacterium]